MSDGEAIEWAVSRLRQRDESRKCLIAISDGAPVDDATLLANSAEYLDHHLRGVVRIAKHAGDIQIAASGIGRPVEQYVSQSVTIDGPEQLEGAVVRLIEQSLCNRPERRRRPSNQALITGVLLP
jgi:cobaltochelatase CobT